MISIMTAPLNNRLKKQREIRRLKTEEMKVMNKAAGY
jgi:hypothetical protein